MAVPSRPNRPNRKLRLESMLRREVAELVQRTVDAPGIGMITITRCEMTGDLQQVTAYWTCLGTPAERQRAAKILDRMRGQIQTGYAPAIHTRLLPTLRFAYDEQEAVRDRMDSLIEQARRSDPIPRSAERQVGPATSGQDAGQAGGNHPAEPK
jgi:ribosome-binding factor A